MSDNQLVVMQRYNPGEKAKAFLRILNGNMGLTPRELDLTATIAERYSEFSAKGLIEPFLSEFIFNTDGRKHLMESMGDSSAQNLGNVLKALVAKGVLGQDGKNYVLNPRLLPKEQVVFNLIEAKK